MPAKGTTRREPWNPLLKSYPDSKKINAVSIGAETLFTRLIAKADDYGNYWGEPRLLTAKLFGLRWANKEITPTDTGRWRAELVTCTYGPLIALYSENGTEYIHLINSRRILRGDVTPDERFPREPDNLEEEALSEYVTRTARPRDENVPLDPDLDLDLDPDPDPTKTQENTYISKKGRKLTGQKLSWFNEFWAIFDYKHGKADAADAWLDIKGLDAKLFATIAVRAKEEAQRRAGLIESGGTPKMAQGWISSRRWEDEPEAAKRGNRAGGRDPVIYALDDAASKVWTVIVETIKAEISYSSFETWFREAVPFALSDGCLKIAVPDPFTKGGIERRYREMIEEIVSKERGEPTKVVIEVGQGGER